MKTQVEFIEELLQVEPALKAVFGAHICDNDEVLPHVFMGDVTRFIIAAAERKNADSMLPKLINFLEVQLATGGDEIENLISVSFIENLTGEVEAISVLIPMMGPCLRKEIMRLSH
jgi:hypothetical protein